MVVGVAKSIALLPCPKSRQQRVRGGSDGFEGIDGGGAIDSTLTRRQTKYTKTHALFISIFRSKDKAKTPEQWRQGSQGSAEKVLNQQVEWIADWLRSYARIDTWDGLAWRLNGPCPEFRIPNPDSCVLRSGSCLLNPCNRTRQWKCERWMWESPRRRDNKSKRLEIYKPAMGKNFNSL